MPRNGSGVYQLPAGSTFQPNTLAQSATVNGITQDIATDLNTPRPIVAGGTGESSPSAAAAALGVLELSGGRMSGDLDMGGNQILNAINLTADHYNRVANGSLQISQENGNTVSPASTANSGYYTADEFSSRWDVSTGSGTIQTALISAASPLHNDGFFINIGSGAGVTLGASSFAVFTHKIEGLRVADLMWGTASAKDAVLRFNVQALAGTYSVRISNNAQNRSYVAQFTVTTNNVWQTITIPIPGDTTGTWATDSTPGVKIDFVAAVGSTYISGTPGWNAGNYYGLTGQNNALASASSGFNITRIGFYADPFSTGLAPSWETLDFTEQFLLCSRYWQNVLVRSAAYNNAAGAYMGAQVALTAVMRAVPTFTYTDLVGAVGKVTITGTHGFTPIGGGAGANAFAITIDLLSPVAINNTWWALIAKLNARM